MCWKTKAGGEKALAVTVIVILPLIVAVALVVTVSVIVAVAARCPGIGDAFANEGWVENPNPHLRRPRS